MRMISRRRRQNFLAVCLLFIMAGSVYLGLPVRSIPVRASPTMRRLFGMFLNVSKVIFRVKCIASYLMIYVIFVRLLIKHFVYGLCVLFACVFWKQDHTENLGYVLGLLAFAISWTSKFPFILKANRGEQGSAVLVSSRLLSSVAGALYGSAILLYDTQLKSVIKTMPWILSAICGSILDLSVSFDWLNLVLCYQKDYLNLFYLLCLDYYIPSFKGKS